MKISSTSDYSLIYSLLYNNTNANRTTPTQTTSNSQQVSGITNIDGDSFKLSGAGNAWRGSLQGSDDNSNALDLKNFLDKVKNGTVTQNDIDAMKEILNSMQENAGAAPPPPPQDDNGLGADIKSFLDKVKNGTVTDDDLKAMQSELSRTDSQAPQGLNSDIQNFLDKVKNGTVTQDDIAAMKEKLSSKQENAGAAPPPPPQDDNGLGADIKSFLDKVKNGTVTDDDLKAMQNELNQVDEQKDTSTTAQNSTNYLFAQLMQAYDNTNITS